MTEDSYDLQRFVEAQRDCFPYERVREELRRGRKEEHWMWFVFPILQGLGKSPKAVKYAISNVEEARAYWEHPVLGPRLRECIELTLANGDKPAVEIFQSGTDTWKFHNCLSLFADALPNEPLFLRASVCFFKDDPGEESDEQN